jgi:predicted RNase H-like nuclease
MRIFIGIDLAWKSDRNHSGGAVLEGDKSALVLREIASGLDTLASIETFIRLHTVTDTVVAIDAPLVIPNPKGQRACETEISRRFSYADASAHTSNLTLYPNARSVQFRKNLENRGFEHCPQHHTSNMSGKWFFEVYPHPAHVILFRRERIIKYKKGRVANRKDGLKEFRQNLHQHLSISQPALKIEGALKEFIDQPLEALRGIALKHYEDKLDAVFCAYLAAYFWAWSYERNEMIGTREKGYIINPRQEAVHWRSLEN